jgi:hypothetical protein
MRHTQNRRARNEAARKRRLAFDTRLDEPPLRAGLVTMTMTETHQIHQQFLDETLGRCDLIYWYTHKGSAFWHEDTLI